MLDGKGIVNMPDKVQIVSKNLVLFSKAESAKKTEAMQLPIFWHRVRCIKNNVPVTLNVCTQLGAHS